MVPCVTSDGPTTVEVLIGPASQLMTEVVDDYPRDVDGSAFIADIEERIQQQRHRWVTPEDMGSADWDL
jgi:hypothetical protein